MPYDEPTPAQFVKRFPEFENLEKPTIQFALDDATASISTTWYDPDYQPAIMFLAAHYLTLAQMAALESTMGGPMSAVVLGPISLTYERAVRGASTGAAESLTKTAYGLRFIEIRDRNVGGPAII